MKIFVLEDDKWYAQMLTHFLSFNPDNDVEVFYDSKSLFNKLHLKPDLITVDLSLPDMSGEDVLKKVKLIDKRINVIIISAAEDVKSAIQL